MDNYKHLLNTDRHFSVGISEVSSSKSAEGVIVVKGYANRAYDDNGKEIVDSDGDVITNSAWDLSNYNKNPILLYQHDHRQPIGKAAKVMVNQFGLTIEAEIHAALHPEAYAGVKAGILKTFSVGFRGREGKYNADTDVFYFTDVLLNEVSVVSVPANQESLFDVVDSPCGVAGCMLSVGELSTKSIADLAIPEVSQDVSANTTDDVQRIKNIEQLLEAISEKLGITQDDTQVTNTDEEVKESSESDDSASTDTLEVTEEPASTEEVAVTEPVAEVAEPTLADQFEAINAALEDDSKLNDLVSFGYQFMEALNARVNAQLNN